MLERGKLPSYERLAAYIFFTATGEEFDAAKDAAGAPLHRPQPQLRRVPHLHGRLRAVEGHVADDGRRPQALAGQAAEAGVRAHQIPRSGVPAPSTASPSSNCRSRSTRRWIGSGDDSQGVSEDRAAKPCGRSSICLSSGEARKATGAGDRPGHHLRLGGAGLGEGRHRSRLPAAQEWPGRTAAHLLLEDSHRRRQDAARPQGDRLGEHPLPAPASGPSAVDRAHHADLQPNLEGAEGPRPSLPPATRCFVRLQNADLGEEHRLQAARRARTPLRAAAHAAVCQPRDKGTTADVPGQRRVRQLLPQRGRRHRPGEAARRSAELEHLRVRKRRVGQAGQDVPRQHTAPVAAAHHPRRRSQSVQPRARRRRWKASIRP